MYHRIILAKLKKPHRKAKTFQDWQNFYIRFLTSNRVICLTQTTN